MRTTSKQIQPKYDEQTGTWKALGAAFLERETAEAYIRAQGQRWFQRASGRFVTTRRMRRAFDRRHGLLRPRRASHSSHLPSVVNENRDARRAQTGRLRMELR